MKYIDYFNNIKEFKSKKEIINDINIIYEVKLSDKEYKILIDDLLINKIIDKSSSKGRCSYISVSYLKSKNFSSGIKYYNYIIKKQNKPQLPKSKILFDETDCIIQCDIEDIFNV